MTGFNCHGMKFRGTKCRGTLKGNVKGIPDRDILGEVSAVQGKCLGPFYM